MDKTFWHTLGWILVISNALGIIILLETIIFKIPYVTLFIGIFFFIWEMNKKIFKQNPKH